MSKIYVAYGSNMNTAQMAHRCATACLVGTGVMHDYELIFRGTQNAAVATIEPKKNGVVPVTIWLIEAEDERTLDVYEGFPNFYTKQDVTFYMGNFQQKGMAYIMAKKYGINLPSENYFNIILDGYIQNSLDTEVFFEAVSRCKNTV